MFIPAGILKPDFYLEKKIHLTKLKSKQNKGNQKLQLENTKLFSSSRALKILQPQFLITLASFIGKKSFLHCMLLGIHKTQIKDAEPEIE